MTSFCERYGITISYSSPYHPHANVQADSSKKSILKILKRTLEQNKRTWHTKLRLSLWADRVTLKKETGQYPFELVYGFQARLPIKNLLPIYQFIQEEHLDVSDNMQNRMTQLIELDEKRRNSQRENMKLQQQMKYLFDKRATERKFQNDDIVLQ